MTVNEPEHKRSSDSWFGLAGVGAVALAIGCCGVLPIAVVLASTVAVGALLGIGAGLIALIAIVAIVVVRARRRAASESPPSSTQGRAASRATRRGLT